MKLLHIILLLFVSNAVVAQKQTNVWYFGNRAGIDFGSGSPVALNDGIMTTEEGCASISDENGKLLFYTDGRRVFNRQHKLMPGGTDLGGSVSSTQSAVIIKSPASDSIYYVFTVGAERQETGLCYSIVNMKREAGMGDIVEKNKQILSGAYEKIGAVNHCNNRDSWVVSRKFNSSEYYSFLVTKNGVQSTPVISRSGVSINGMETNSIGVLRFSSNGKKVAGVNSYENDVVELMDFDGLTGVLSNPKLLKANPGAIPAVSITGAYGAEFSGDSKLLYISWYNTGVSKGLISQFDVNAGSAAQIQASVVKVADINALPGAMQMGPDHKIYVSCFHENYLSTINKPDIKGTGCDFRYQSLKIGEPNQRFCYAGLPSFVQSYFSPTSLAFEFKRNGECYERNARFFINRIAGADSVLWNFGDPASGLANTSKLYEPSHSYPESGVYQVSLVVYKDDCTHTNDTVKQEIWISDVNRDLLGPDRLICSGESIEVSVPVQNVNYTWSDGSSSPVIEIKQTGLYWLEVNQLGCTQRDSIVVDFKPTPSVSLGRDTALCAGEKVMLDGTTPGATYKWNTGQATPQLLVSNTGLYSVEVNVQGCVASDTVLVQPGSCKLFIPNAFTPNGDGLNDSFGMLNAGSVYGYSLQVYDRWGRKVFETKNQLARWDGMNGGRPASPGTYVWILSYIKNGEQIPIKAKGQVQLIR